MQRSAWGPGIVGTETRLSTNGERCVERFEWPVFGAADQLGEDQVVVAGEGDVLVGQGDSRRMSSRWMS